MHLSEPAGQRPLTALHRAGAEPVCYMAYQNVVCRADRDLVAAGILDLPGVAWLGPFLPEYKLAPELRSPSADVSELVLCLWPEEPAAPVVAAVNDAGGSIVSASPRTIRCRVEPDQAARLAGMQSVSWVQSPDPPQAFNFQAQWVLQTGWQSTIPGLVDGRRVWAKGIRGQNMVVGLFDSGICTEHDQFRDPGIPLTAPGIYPRHRKLAGYKLYDGALFGDFPGFHGSSVAGTLAGDDSVCGDASKDDGMAPDARIFFVDVGAVHTYVFEDDLSDLLDSVRLAPGLGMPVLQVSGSFGSNTNLSYYRLMDASVDAVAWNDKDFLVLWAAGNTGLPEYKIGHPGCAKNILTVGASGNGTASNTVPDFSSRGPTRDGRIKPNILAPGQYVTTVDGPDPSDYSRYSGTSYSAPAASGALVLARQYFKEGWFPSGRPDSANSIPLPSASLMRALAIAGADPDIGSEFVPGKSIGWGRLDLQNMLHFDDDSLGLTFVDEKAGLAGGQLHIYQVEITEREPMEVVLAWTDTAAAPEALITLVNDLDLEIISPDLNGYRGNQMIFGESRPNPAERDSRNVEEVCRLSLPLTGVWTIQVRARSVFTETQPYALVVRGRIHDPSSISEVPEHAPAGATAGATVVTRAFPFRLRVRGRTRLTILSPDGRIVGTASTDREGIITWDGGRVSSGVYFYRLEPADGHPALGRILLVR